MTGSSSSTQPVSARQDGRPAAARTKLHAVPVSLREANDFVAAFHRHNGRTARDGGKFAIGCSTGDQLVGVAIVGNPLARALMDGATAEVLRVCVSDLAPKNTCSFLYGRCWRAWNAMGGARLVTYTLGHESGSSPSAAGFRVVAQDKLRTDWINRTGNANRTWNPPKGQLKLRWEKTQ